MTWWQSWVVDVSFNIIACLPYKLLEGTEDSYPHSPQVGRSFHCKKRGGDGTDTESRTNGNFAGETWHAVAQALKEEDPDVAEALALELSMSQRGLCAAEGAQVIWPCPETQLSRFLSRQ
jgi:hypothetical protein